MPSHLIDKWYRATVFVENQWNGGGTGFLVADESERVFLVTNKHVLNPYKEIRVNASRITVHHAVVSVDERKIEPSATELPLKREDWREHPDNATDILAFDLSTMLEQSSVKKTFANVAIHLTYIAHERTYRNEDICPGDQVAVLGYPLGARVERTNAPLVRFGVISSWIGEQIRRRIEWPPKSGIFREDLLRAFWVDGAIIPGTSGSPVVLMPKSIREKDGALQIRRPIPVMVGIIAENHEALRMGLAFEAPLVRDVIGMFSSDPPPEQTTSE